MKISRKNYSNSSVRLEPRLNGNSSYSPGVRKSEETLAEFVGQLRMLADRAYPDWEPKQRLELARNQFIQGIQCSTTQLVLMKEKPKDLVKALELAQATEAVQAAQKRMRTSTPAVNAVEEDEVNALRTPVRASAADLKVQELGLAEQTQPPLR